MRPPMPRTLNVLLAQLSPRLRRTEANIEMMEKLIAGHPEADLAVFPELFLSGYTTAGLEDLAVDPDGPEIGRVARAARDHSTAVIVGVPERLGGEYANSAVYIGRDGTVAGVYRKTHLFGSERGAFVPGDDLLVVDVEGSKAGLMICFDVEFPEVARSLARAGADLLVTISANMEPFGRDHHVFAVARAIENGLPHAYVNQIGPGEEFTFTGGTMAVSADGDLLAESDPAAEEVLFLRLDLPARSSLRPDYLNQARPPLPVTGDVTSTPEGHVHG
jgi:predicted amidohydrolase